MGPRGEELEMLAVDGGHEKRKFDQQLMACPAIDNDLAQPADHLNLASFVCTRSTSK